MTKKTTKLQNHQINDEHDEDLDYEHFDADILHLLTQHQSRDKLNEYDTFDYLNERD